MKKKKAVNNYKNDNMRMIIILTVMISLVISMSTYWIYAYEYKYGKSEGDNRFISYKISDYIEVEGNYVYVKNIDNNINDEFVNQQRSILSKNNVIDTDIIKGLYNDILSIRVLYTLENGSNESVTLNVNLRDNKIISNDELLEMVNVTYKDIATDIFNDYIKLNSNKDVIDNVTGDKMTSKEFNDNGYKYIIRIREMIPDTMKLYVYNDRVYYDISLTSIGNVCYQYDFEDILINNEIGKI